MSGWRVTGGGLGRRCYDGVRVGCVGCSMSRRCVGPGLNGSIRRCACGVFGSVVKGREDGYVRGTKGGYVREREGGSGERGLENGHVVQGMEGGGYVRETKGGYVRGRKGGYVVRGMRIGNVDPGIEGGYVVLENEDVQEREGGYVVLFLETKNGHILGKEDGHFREMENSDVQMKNADAGQAAVQ